MKEIEEDTHTHQKTPYNHGLEELILLTRPFYLKTKKKFNVIPIKITKTEKWNFYEITNNFEKGQPENEKHCWRQQASWSHTMPQSYSNQNWLKS